MVHFLYYSLLFTTIHYYSLLFTTKSFALLIPIFPYYSLLGNSKMAIVCCVTPAEKFLEETRSTLQFASRAKEVKVRNSVFIISTISLFVYLFIYSFIHSFIYSFIHLFIHIHSSLHSFIPSSIHSFIHLSIYSFLFQVEKFLVDETRETCKEMATHVQVCSTDL